MVDLRYKIKKLHGIGTAALLAKATVWAWYFSCATYHHDVAAMWTRLSTLDRGAILWSTYVSRKTHGYVAQCISQAVGDNSHGSVL